jgi:hypothetical protein
MFITQASGNKFCFWTNRVWLHSIKFYQDLKDYLTVKVLQHSWSALRIHAYWSHYQLWVVHCNSTKTQFVYLKSLPWHTAGLLATWQCKISHECINNCRDPQLWFYCLWPPTIQPRLGAIWLPPAPKNKELLERTLLLVLQRNQESGEDVLLSARHTVLSWQAHATTWIVGKLWVPERWVCWEGIA